ncbi:M14 family metallopeptidase [Pseudomonas moorei]|uniref:M14 family metallopeptidase n=1 Tax=Pseudomonas moorei TaxID=395599 RepID=UPI001FF220B1|nr:M14 family metallopeptidase [Pseudomonas moorei]
MMNAEHIDELFSDSYAQAREKFFAAAHQRGLSIDSYELDLKGARDETLATDVVFDGPRDASKVLIVLSGVHGVEGFPGSAVQTGALQLDPPKPDDTAILYVHAINPHGFSHLRRVTQENVDLNRNFIQFNGSLPQNEGYHEIHEALLPAQWPPEDDQVLQQYRLTHGDKKFQCAISLGQYQYPDGMFFGGQTPTWSNTTFRQILRIYAANAAVIASVDVHTGLGPYGYGEKIFATRDICTLKNARNWWGEITDVHAGSSTSVPMSGPIQVAISQECPLAKHIGICLEFGTYPIEEMIMTLRADHWVFRHGKQNTAQSSEITQQLKDLFYPNHADWKTPVWTQASTVVTQALQGLENW